MMAGRLVIQLGAACLALAACQSPGEAMRTTDARIGDHMLTVGIPEGFDAIAQPDGIRLQPQDAATRRAVYTIAITLDGTPSPTPLTERRTVGDAEVRYATSRAPGGSGGDEFTLLAERPCDGATVRLRLDTQADEGADPDLEPVWTVLAAARCRAAAAAAEQN